MSGGDWLRDLTSSKDPAMNAATVAVLILAGTMLVVVGGIFLLPVVVVVGIAKGVHWYMTRPTPTDQLYALAQQRTIAANFPDPEKFNEAFVERMVEAAGDDLPTYQLFGGISHVADQLYAAESLCNPL